MSQNTSPLYDFWNDKWKKNDTPWDQSHAHKLLSRLVAQKNIFFHDEEHEAESITKKNIEELKELSEVLAKDTQQIRLALVPGCGTGYDVQTLSELPNIEKAIGVDLSEIAMEKATKLYQKEVNESKVEFVTADFFKLHEKYGGKVDLIWDYTFLCALPPSMRKDWAEETTKLIKKGGYLLSLVFPIKPFKGSNGPPHPFTVDTVKELLGDNFELVYDQKLHDRFSDNDRNGYEWYTLWRRL